MQVLRSSRAKSGRFAKGNPGGPGRPRRPDFFTVVSERAGAAGVDIGAELWRICQVLMSQAKGGNVQAAKLLFSHLCSDPEPSSNIGLTVDVDVPMSDVELSHRIRAIFAGAAPRLMSEGKLTESGEMQTATECGQ